MELKVIGADILNYVQIYMQLQIVIGMLNIYSKEFDERLKQDYLIYINMLRSVRRYRRNFFWKSNR